MENQDGPLRLEFADKRFDIEVCTVTRRRHEEIVVRKVFYDLLRGTLSNILKIPCQRTEGVAPARKERASIKGPISGLSRM